MTKILSLIVTFKEMYQLLEQLYNSFSRLGFIFRLINVKYTNISKIYYKTG